MHYVVSAALDNACGGNEGELRLFLKLGDSKRAAVAHCGLNLCKGKAYIVLKTARVGNVGVNPLFKGKLFIAA